MATAPTSPDDIRAQLRAKLLSGISIAESADANWANLTPAQKDQAAQLAIRGVAKLARLALYDLDAS